MRSSTLQNEARSKNPWKLARCNNQQKCWIVSLLCNNSIKTAIFNSSQFFLLTICLPQIFYIPPKKYFQKSSRIVETLIFTRVIAENYSYITSENASNFHPIPIENEFFKMPSRKVINHWINVFFGVFSYVGPSVLTLFRWKGLKKDLKSIQSTCELTWFASTNLVVVIRKRAIFLQVFYGR